MPFSKVREDYQNPQHYGDYDYGDDASSGSKDGANDDMKKSLTAEKVDAILDLLNKLSKEFGNLQWPSWRFDRLVLNFWLDFLASILGKESAAVSSKDAKGSKDSKDKDSKDSKDGKDKDSKDAKDKDSKDGKGAKSDYDYDGGSQAGDATTSSTSMKQSFFLGFAFSIFC